MNNPIQIFRINSPRYIRLALPLSIAILILLNISEVYGQKKKHKRNNKSPQIDTLNLASDNGTYNFQLTFLKGKAHNHPTFAIWLEDMNGKYIETLFVTQYIATGVFGHADGGDGTWEKEAGEAIRPAALPYWSHKRNIVSRGVIYTPTPENPVPDAISGATPIGSFVMNTTAQQILPVEFKLMMEINQTWDWNDFWTNNKYPEDKDYKTSAQPSIIYESTINQSNTTVITTLNAIGHGHYSGKDGKLYEDISTLSTALQIANQVQVKIQIQD